MKTSHFPHRLVGWVQNDKVILTLECPYDPTDPDRPCMREVASEEDERVTVAAPGCGILSVLEEKDIELVETLNAFQEGVILPTDVDVQTVDGAWHVLPWLPSYGVAGIGASRSAKQTAWRTRREIEAKADYADGARYGNDDDEASALRRMFSRKR